jgi:hypothetical protein
MTAEEWERKVREERTSKDVILAIGIEDIMPPEDIRLLRETTEKWLQQAIKEITEE